MKSGHVLSRCLVGSATAAPSTAIASGRPVVAEDTGWVEVVASRLAKACNRSGRWRRPPPRTISAASAACDRHCRHSARDRRHVLQFGHVVLRTLLERA